jgi:hypothetical protein
MLTLVMVLALQDSITFAKTLDNSRPPPTRIYITPNPRTLDDALEPFRKPPMKCVPHPAKPMTENQKFLAEATEQKQPEEVEQYLRCYAPKNYPNYVAKYRGMIDAAAKEFQVDGSLMRCLLLRESQFDSSMISCTCAMGLGQQTSDNLLSMKGTVSATFSGPAWTNYMNQMRQKDPGFSNSCSGEFKRSDEETNTTSGFYKLIMAGQEKGCGIQATPCHVFRQDDRRCPAASIAASAAYLKYIDSIVRKAVNCGQLESWQIPDSRIALALAYNAGEGTAQKALAKADNENTTISINFLDNAAVSHKKLDEMRNHYRALRFCLHKGETDPPSIRDTRKPECFKALPQTMVNGSGVSR